jgi:hypothetical protein
MRSRDRGVSSAVAVYIIVLLALQMFLLTVALDALQAVDPTTAWTTAIMSVALGIGSLLFYRYIRG